MVWSSGPVAWPPMASARAASTVAVNDLGLRRPTLDDVFLQLTGTHAGEDGAGDGELPGDGQVPEEARADGDERALASEPAPAEREHA